jgi:hypothetical protein
MRPVIALAVVLCSACLHRLDGWSSTAVGTPGDRPLSEVVSEALPSVVLIVSSKGDGKTIYGAGLILGPGSLVLTNLHVLGDEKSIGVLLYKPQRLSYTPMDGGLDRFLFENQKDIVSAEMVREDPTLDLAVIHIDADTSKYPVPRFATEPPHRGEPVLALGHPQETVWSFTSGVVSTLHHAAIQHDAAINPGSSGGPLLNARGEVIGINTSKLFSGTDGVAFARPIAMAKWLLSEDSDPGELDLSSPALAAASCIHAQEIGSPRLSDCLDWDRRWDVLEEAAAAIKDKADATRLDQALTADGGKAGWISRNRRSVVRFVRQENPPASTPAPLPPLPPELRAWVAVHSKLDDARTRRLKEKNGMTVKLEDPQAVREVLRKGMRVDLVTETQPGLAWVLLVGRNLDGTQYRYSEAWSKRGNQWLQEWPPTEEQLKQLPKDYPPPLDLPNETLVKLALTLVGQLYDMSAPVEPPMGGSIGGGSMDHRRCCLQK